MKADNNTRILLTCLRTSLAVVGHIKNANSMTRLTFNHRSPCRPSEERTHIHDGVRSFAGRHVCRHIFYYSFMRLTSVLGIPVQTSTLVVELVHL